MSTALLEITAAHSWDGMVKDAGGHLLQSWSWGELKGQFGWTPLRIAARDLSGKAALAQVLIRRQFGLTVCYVPRGPVWSNDAALDTLLIDGLVRLARRRRAIFLRLEPNVESGSPTAAQLHSTMLLRGFEPAQPMQPSTSIHLGLRPSADELFAAFSKGHRADIKRAAKKGVAVRIGTSQADLDLFYGLMEETGRRAGFAIHSHDYYRTAWQIFGGMNKRGEAHLLIAELEGKAVAAFLIFGWGREGQYMYSAASQEGLRSGANHLLQWEAIQWAKQRGCALYDFWGIPDALGEAALADDPAERDRLEEAGKDHPLAGVYRFKKGFGGHVVRYLPAYDYVLLRPAYWLWQRRRGE